VDLQYSPDGVVWTPAVSVTGAAATNLTNVPNGVTSFSWRIPNVTASAMKLRLIDRTDATDPTPPTVESLTFTTGYYLVNFEVRDLLTNLAIPPTLNVTGNETLIGNPGGAYPWNVWAESLLSGIFQKSLPYGSWNVTFTQPSYGDQGTVVLVNKDHTDLDPTDADTSDDPIRVYMETKIVHVWEAITDLTYDVPSNTLYTASTLKRDGITVTGANSCEVKLYDGATLILPTPNPLKSTSSPPLGFQGFYNFTWAGTTLVTGKVYNVVTTMTNATGGTFNSPRTFSITEVKQLQDVQNTVSQKLDKPLSQVESAISNTVTTKLDAQTTTINTKMDQQTTLIQQKLDDFSGKVSTSIVSLESAAARSQTATTNLEKAADRSLIAAGELETVGKRYAGRLLVPVSVLLGEKVTLRYRAGAKLIPLIDLFTTDEKDKEVTIKKAQPMVESKTEPGLYEYEIEVTAENRFVAGKPFTVFVQEKTTGNLEAGSVFVESTSLGALQGLVASDLGTKKAAQDTLDLLSAIKGTLAGGGEVGQALELLKVKVDRIPKAISEDVGTMQMRSTVNEVADRIKQLAGDEGYDFSELVKKGLEESPSIGEIRESTDEIGGATEVMQILMERKLGGIDEPVIHVTYQ
jgi:hypothetical protein